VDSWGIEIGAVGEIVDGEAEGKLVLVAIGGEGS
jgi:hypothetical protein